mgnify:CR=1 FL=1
METVSVFDRLSAQLTDDDRRRMLSSIRETMQEHAVPLAAEQEEPPGPVDQQVKALSIWRRIVLFLLILFRGADQEEVVRRWMLHDLELIVHRDGGEAIDGRRHLFLTQFAEDLANLRDAAAQLERTIRGITNYRQDIVMILAMDLFPSVHQDLRQQTSSEQISKLQEPSERVLKRMLSDALDERIDQIPPDARSAMRRAMSQGDSLVKLVSVGYDAMVTAFESSPSGGSWCAFDYLDRPLTELYRNLVHLQEPLDLTLLESLALLAESLSGDQSGEENGTTHRAAAQEAMQAAIRKRMSDMFTAFDVYRSFMEGYPLQAVIRIVREDPWWAVEPATAGEDWIGIYRAFFTERIQRQVLSVTLQHQLLRRLDELADACGGALRHFPGLPDGSNGTRTAHWFLGAALESMAEGLWHDALSPLRIILTGGEFYKSSNRAQFNDAYNEFEAVADKIDRLKTDLAPGQAWGSMLSAEADATQRTKMTRRVDQELITLADQVRTTFEVIVNVLGGILYARPGSSYDTLANYGQIGGRRNAEFLDELRELHRRLGVYSGVLGELDALERRAAENNIHLSSPLPELAVHSADSGDRTAAGDMPVAGDKPSSSDGDSSRAEPASGQRVASDDATTG